MRVSPIRVLVMLLILFAPYAIHILILRQGIDFSQYTTDPQVMADRMNQGPTERDLQYLAFWEKWFGTNERFMEAELERLQAEEEYEAIRARGYR